jgi:uncharacterized protein (TIGR02246 family)
MAKRILGLIIFISLFTSLSLFAKPKKKKKPTPDPRIEIQAVLNSQQKAWNDGKLEIYMQGYWNSDSLTFVGKRGVTRGWKNTLENYKKSYPDKAAMGKLKLDILNIKLVARDVAFVVGKWDLTRTAGNVGGHFTLLMRKIKNKWVIVADHSS